jgi:type I restriction enzyme S subunit
LDSDSYPLITSRNFENGIINFQSARRISAKDHFEIQKRSKVEKYDILFSMIGGNIGNQVLVTTESSFSIKNVALFKYYNRELTYPYFIKVFLEHLAIRLQQEAIGGAQPFVSLGYFRKLPFPLPPIAEQRRIVAKVDQLMALVDELETQLAASRAIARNLLEAVVAELTSIEHVSSANGASHPSLGQGPGLYTHRGAVQGRDAFPKRPGE